MLATVCIEAIQECNIAQCEAKMPLSQFGVFVRLCAVCFTFHLLFTYIS